MAYWYMTSIRCVDKIAALAFVAKYDGQTMLFEEGKPFDGEVCNFSAERSLGADGGYWVNVLPHTVADIAPLNDEECERANQYNDVIYGMLRNDRDFLYAISGVECGEFRNLEDMKRNLINNDPVLNHMHGLIVSIDMLGSSPLALFRPFSDTHLWIPQVKEVPYAG